MNPLIDVCILTKNEKSTIKKCLDSLLNDSYKNFRILICDGNSRDGTTEIIMEYAKRHKNIKLYIQKTKGCGAARRELMQHVEAKYTAWTDGGAVLSKHWIYEITSPLFNSSKTIVGVGGVQYSTGNPLGQSIALILHLSPHTKSKKPDIYEPIGNNVSFKTSVLLKNKWSDIPYGDDAEMNIRLLNKGYRFIWNPNAKIFVDMDFSWKSFFKWLKRRSIGMAQITKRNGDYRRFIWSRLKYFIAPFTLSILLFTEFQNYSVGLGILLLLASFNYVKQNSWKLAEPIKPATYIYFPIVSLLWSFFSPLFTIYYRIKNK